MKKVIPLFLAIIMAIVSCGDKKDNPNPDDPNKEDPNKEDPSGEKPSDEEAKTLPEKIVMTSGGETETYTITYQGSTAKIDKVTQSSGGVETYVYDGDRIQKIHWGPVSNGDYTSYSYDGSGRLTKEEKHRSGKEDIETTGFSYSGTKATMLDGGLKVEMSYDSEGNFTSAALSGESEEGKPVTGAISITYDAKNAPFKNVLGWKKIRPLVGAPLGDNIGIEDIVGAGKNPIKLTGNIEMFGGKVEVSYTYEFKDSENPKFPTKITGAKKVGTADTETFTAEITYK